MFLNKFFLLLLVAAGLLVYSNHIAAQDIPDTLQRKLNIASNDSVKARTLLDIGEAIESTETEKSFDYYQQALALSKKIKNNHLALSSLNDIGVCYIELNKMDSAVETFEQAIPVVFVSPFTVDSHRKNLLAKLDVKNTAMLIRFAVENKLV